MNIVSYRGPNSAGGVAAALRTLMSPENKADIWYFLNNTDIEFLESGKAKATKIASLDQALLAGHYRFANEFLWPVFHGLSSYARLNQADMERYDLFNRCLALDIASGADNRFNPYFIHDYQLALLPLYLASFSDAFKCFFWHIPWPELVPPFALPKLIEIAASLLKTDKLGFHTGQYRTNFMRFVEEHLESVFVDFETHIIHDKKSNSTSEILATPLGIDNEFWSRTMAESILLASLPDGFGKLSPYVLSVDRADYTKGIRERLIAIECFFKFFPEYKGKLRFVQICAPSRKGLSAFDNYWSECRRIASSINQAFGEKGWIPIVWLEDPVDIEVLALFYNNAAALLISSIKDGLNLTAKEFIACQTVNPGVLILSKFAGVADELGDDAILIDPHSIEQIVLAVKQALSLSESKRKEMLMHASNSNKQNSLAHWYQNYTLDRPSVLSGLA